MKKALRISGIIFAIILLLIAGLAIAAKILITPERIRATVLPKASERLHREVTLGDIGISLFKGITLHDLKVMERDTEEPFIAADEVVLRYQFWPLLAKRIIIDEIRLEAPRIRIERLPGGGFNFSDLLPADTAPAKTDAAPPAPAGSAVDLLVSEVAVKNGLVLFMDRVINRSAPLEYKIENLDFLATDISLEKEFPFSLKAILNGAPLETEGRINVASRGGAARVRLDNFDVTALSPYFAAKLPGKLGSLRLGLALEMEGSSKALATSGRIDMKQLDLTLDALKDAPVRGANASLDFRLKADLANTRLNIEEAKADFNGIPMTMSGIVENYSSDPMLNLNATIADLDLRRALAAVPAGLVKDAKGLDPAGILGIQAHLAGPVSKPRDLVREAEIRLEGVQANVAGLRPALTGALLLRGDELASRDLALVAGDNRAAIELKAGNLFGKPIRLSSRVNAEQFHLEPLLQVASTPAAAESKSPPEVAPAAKKEIGPFDLPLQADGSIKLGQTIYKGLVIDSFDLHYVLDKNILTVDRLSGNMAKGSFQQTARVDLAKKGLEYTTRLELRGMQADALVLAFVPKASGVVFGTLGLNAEMNGRGTLPETLKRNLSGKGTFTLVDGKLTGTGLVRGLADFLKVEELRELKVQQAKGAFTITNGKVSLNSDFSGKDVRFAPRGTIGLDGALDLGLDLRLSPALTARLDRRNIAQFFTDSEGWGQIPLKAAGTVRAPRFALDTTAVKGRVKEKAREEIEKKLQEKVFDRMAPKKGEDGAEEPSQKLIEEGLKKLFGR